LLNVASRNHLRCTFQNILSAKNTSFVNISQMCFRFKICFSGNLYLPNRSHPKSGSHPKLGSVNRGHPRKWAVHQAVLKKRPKSPMMDIPFGSTLSSTFYYCVMRMSKLTFTVEKVIENVPRHTCFRFKIRGIFFGPFYLPPPPPPTPFSPFLKIGPPPNFWREHICKFALA
jgi:hypothetical protein